MSPNKGCYSTTNENTQVKTEGWDKLGPRGLNLFVKKSQNNKLGVPLSRKLETWEQNALSRDECHKDQSINQLQRGTIMR